MCDLRGKIEGLECGNTSTGVDKYDLFGSDRYSNETSLSRVKSVTF